MQFLSSKNLFIAPISLGLCLLIGSILYHYIEHHNPNFPIQRITSECDLKDGLCKVELDKEELIFVSVQSTTLPTLSPLSVDIHFDNLNPVSVSVDFIGVDIDMGENKPTLSIQPNGHYTGRTLLPTSPKPQMKWKVLVTFNTLDKLYETSFYFTANKPKLES